MIRGKNESIRAFTIVELLIVIVVIGILAAITIVAFNGVQNRTKVASLQSDLEGASKTLEAYRYTNISITGGEFYPVNLPAANLKASTNTVYQYMTNTASSPTGYCLTATNADMNYSVSSTNSGVRQGTCTVNYVPNPSAEGATNLLVSAGAPGIVISPTTFSGWPINGAKSFKVSATTTADTRVRPINNVIPVVSGKSIQTSAYIYNASAGPRVFDVTFQTRTSGGAPGSAGPTSTFTIPAGQAMLVSGVLSSSVDLSAYVAVEPMFNREASSGATTSSAGDIFYIDNVMLSYADSVQPYADGNSAGWQWIGASNDSASMGPL